MRTKVFAYKGFVGIKSSFNAEGLLNDPSQEGQLGFVLDADYVDVSPEALEILELIPKSGDDIGDVDVFMSGDKVIFSFLGGPLKIISANNGYTGSSDYDPKLLKTCEDVEIDKDFIDFVNGLLIDYN